MIDKIQIRDNAECDKRQRRRQPFQMETLNTAQKTGNEELAAACAASDDRGAESCQKNAGFKIADEEKEDKQQKQADKSDRGLDKFD